MSITNSEKFKTVEERTIEFDKFCKGNRNCINCKVYKAKKDQFISNCTFVWLGLEADEEKLLPCPFCGSEDDVEVITYKFSDCKMYRVKCRNINCPVCAETTLFNTKDEAIATWNKRA